MSKYRDEYDDYEDDYEDDDTYEDDVDDDEDAPPPKSASNPFGSRSDSGSGQSGRSGVSGAGLPPRPAPGSGSGTSGGGITTPSPIRGASPFGGGSSGSGSSGGSGGSGTPSRPSPFGGSGSSGSSSGSGGSIGSGSSSGSGGSGSFGQPRPNPFGGSGSSSGSGGSSGGSSSGSSGGTRPNLPGSPPSGGAAQRPNLPGSPPSGGSGARPNLPGSPPSGGSGERRDEKRDDKPAANPFGARPSGGSPSSGSGSYGKPDDKRDDKKDEKSSGGGLGSRIGGGLPFGKKDDDKKDDRRDEKPSGGGLGSRIGGGLPFGKKDDDKKDDKKDEKSSGGGLGGRIGGALPFGKKADDKKDDKPAASAASSPGARPASTSSPFGSGSSSSSSSTSGTGARPFGSGTGSTSGGYGGSSSSGGAKPAAPAASGGDSKSGGLGSLTKGLAGKLPFGAGSKDAPKGDAKSAKADTKAVGGTGIGGKVGFGGGKADTKDSKNATAPKGAKASAAAAVPLGDRLRGGLRSMFNPQPDPKSAKARISKAPKVESTGMSLDTKLDIIGVVLVLGSLAVLLSSLSPSQGAVFGQINRVLSEGFGWGALAIPIAALGVGAFLILRHFGDEAPVIGAQRLIGIVLFYVGLLVVMQFVFMFQYPIQSPSFEQYLETVRQVYLPSARGGGLIGGEIYLFLISNFSEIGGFVIVLAVEVIGIMLALRLSAAEIAVIIMSIGRSFGTSVTRRRQASTVRRLEREELAQQKALAAQSAQPGGISVMRPPDTLPAGKPAALPAPIPAPPIPEPVAASIGEERKIQLTARGQTMAFPTGSGESAPVTASSAAPPVSVPVTSAPAPADTAKQGGLFGRFGAGRSAQPPPVTAPASAPAPAPVGGDAAKQGGLFGRFGGQKPAAPAPASSSPAAAAAIGAAAAAASITTPPPAQTSAPAASVQPEPVRPPAPVSTGASSTPAPERASLGDLVRGTMPAASTPAPAETAKPAEAPKSSGLGVQPLQRPPLSASAPAAKPAASDDLYDDDFEKAASPIPGLTSPVLTARSPRLAGQDGERPPQRVESAPPPPPPSARSSSPSPINGDVDPFPVTHARPRMPKTWKLPETSQTLMSGQDQELDHALLLRRAKIIEETLDSFGAPGRVVEVRTGPVITQFGIEPDYILARGKKSRVKVGAIAGLDKDLQLALGAKSIRIEAPVPGKGYVGIEVPNEQSAIVRLRDVMESEQFKRINKPLTIALGQGVDGTPVAADLTGMPHLLIAGTTGSGKSVCVNSIIASLLIRNTPETLKFIMVDPKRVELTQYNGIPHLVAPVVVELERIVSVLKWVTREMDERYRRFNAAGARNIEDFNRHLRQGEDLMPYMVVIIDELADLMMLAPDETEKVITRIAALARATGIHLVIATQRPSVDVVTGLIKANFPARIAFAVAGGVDSRVILDQPGAERLLGRGDMLYMSGDSPAPVRLQGVFVSDTEINNITRAWRTQMTEEDLIAASRPISSSFQDEPRMAVGDAWNPLVTGRGTPGQPNTSVRPVPGQSSMWDQEARAQSMVRSMPMDDRDDADDDDEEDVDQEMYNKAVELVRQRKKASVSLLQRQLRIGYTRAARLIDMMEERGIVGPAKDGSNPRDVIG